MSLHILDTIVQIWLRLNPTSDLLSPVLMSSDGGHRSHVWGPNAVDCEEENQIFSYRNTFSVVGYIDKSPTVWWWRFDVDYWPVWTAVTETQHLVFKVLHGRQCSCVILRLAPYGLFCFVRSNDDRDLSHPIINRVYHYKKHISSLVGWLKATAIV